MIKAIVPALLFVAAIAGPASAQTSGNQMLKGCEEQVLYARGYTAAVWDFVILNFKQTICIPKGVTVGQVEDIICGYIEKHPESRHEHTHSLAVNALTEAFPCNN